MTQLAPPPPSLAAATAKFQVNLNVTDLDRSLRFYQVLLGVAPVMHNAGHARFELEQPPLVLGVDLAAQVPGGSLNHVGFRLPDSTALVDLQRRLEEAGIATQRQEGIECCYARQTKFWVTDPDRHLWELYVLEEDIDHSGFEDAPLAPPPIPATVIVWEHRLTDPIPERIPQPDASVDEVRLEGTLNVRPEELQAGFWTEVRRVLRPDGRLVAHGLASDTRLAAPPALPGLAALVRHVPSAPEVLDVLAAAGFVGMHFDKLSATCCLPDGAGGALREMRLTARRSEKSVENRDRHVLYKGPLGQVTDDDGRVFTRGEKVAVSAAVAQQLRRGPAAGQFLFYPAGEAAPACCGSDDH